MILYALTVNTSKPKGLVLQWKDVLWNPFNNIRTTFENEISWENNLRIWKPHIKKHVQIKKSDFSIVVLNACVYTKQIGIYYQMIIDVLYCKQGC